MNAGGVDQYRLKFALNFDAVFSTFITAPNTGWIDSTINRMTVDTQPTNGTDVRIVFDPANYAINDSRPFWLQFAPVSDGIEGTPGAPTLVLPDASNYGVKVFVIKGVAPSAGPLQLDFPKVMQNVQVNNEGADNLLVGTEDGGPMAAILPSLGIQSLTWEGGVPSLWVQGDGANVPFSATTTFFFPW